MDRSAGRRVGPLTWLLLALVRGYQLVVSPWFPPTCRYYPSCSAFAVGSLRTHGAGKGLLLATWRVLRCNPWSKGGVDHVPERGAWVGRRVPLPDPTQPGPTQPGPTQPGPTSAGEETHHTVEGAPEHPMTTGTPGASTLRETERGAGDSSPQDHREQPS